MNPHPHSQQPTPPGTSTSWIERFGPPGVLLLLLLVLTPWCSTSTGGRHHSAVAPARRLANHHIRRSVSTEVDRLLADARTAAAMLRYLLEPESTAPTNQLAISNASPIAARQPFGLTS